MKCPVCGNREYCRFVFADCVNEQGQRIPNQCDFDEIFVCPQLHVYDKDGRIVEMDRDTGFKIN